MSKYDRMVKWAIAAVIAGLLSCPSSASANDVQIFPPQQPPNPYAVPPVAPNTLCPPAPAGYTYTLVWDGQNNVQCASVPLTCGPGQGLQYDSTPGDPNEGNFICVTACSGPSYGFNVTKACDPGQMGQQGYPIVVTCDGVVHQGPFTNTCQAEVTIQTTSQSFCVVGTPLVGQLTGGVLNSLICVTDPTACSNYTCNAAGAIVPSP